MTDILVSGLFIYPVKGLGGIAVTEAAVSRRGLVHDRRFMIVDADGEFVSQREVPRMATVWTDLHDGMLELAMADREPVRVEAQPAARLTRPVRVWNSVVAAHGVDAAADEWLSDALGFDARLVYMPDSAERACNPEYAEDAIVSFADGYPVLIASEASLADLNGRIAAGSGQGVPMNRFRANIVVRGATAWDEDGWRDFAIGACGFRAVKPCTRCQVTSTDQASGELRGPEPLRTLAAFRDSPSGVRFGVNLVPTALGTLRIGDAWAPA